MGFGTEWEKRRPDLREEDVAACHEVLRRKAAAFWMEGELRTTARWVLHDTVPTGPLVKVPPHNLKGESAAWVDEKLEEEVAELRAELRAPDLDQRRVDEEVGDILFVVANLARRVGTEPETGLRAANRKFRRRFGHIERRIAERGGDWREVTLATLDQFWEEAKRMERESPALEPSVEGKSLA